MGVVSDLIAFPRLLRVTDCDISFFLFLPSATARDLRWHPELLSRILGVFFL